mgnify:CR=1 FL=1
MKHERQLSAYLSKREFSNRAGDTAYFKRKDLEENLKIIEASLTDEQVDLLREFAGREPDVTSFNQGVMNNKEVLDIDWELTQQFFDSPKNMKKTKKEHLGRETEKYLKQIFERLSESKKNFSDTIIMIHYEEGEKFNFNDYLDEILKKKYGRSIVFFGKIKN